MHTLKQALSVCAPVVVTKAVQLVPAPSLMAGLYFLARKYEQ